MSTPLSIAKTLNAKRIQIESLLALTRAINNNTKEKNLYEIYTMFLCNQLKVKNFALLYLNENWENACSFGLPTNLDIDEIISNLLYTKKIVDLNETHFDIDHVYRFVIPVFHKDQALAYLLVSELGLDELGTVEEKLNYIETYTNILVSAIENKRLYKRQLAQASLKKELELAAKMQALLIPTKFPENNNLSIDALYLPHSQIGGDYYDYLQIDEIKSTFCMADVSGKGVAAALLMSNFQANFKAQSKQNLAVDVMIKNINEIICEITQNESFITLFLAKYNNQSKKLKYVNAGHVPPMIINEDGIQYLTEGTTLIGMFNPLPNIKVAEIIINKPSLLVLFTDGLTDVENDVNEYFGDNMLEQFCKNYYTLNPVDFNKLLIEKITQYKGKKGFIDDISLFSCKIS